MSDARISTDEFLRGDETVVPRELVYGMVRDAAAPTPGHQWIVGQFFLALSLHLRPDDATGVWMAPVDVVLDPVEHLVVQPDLIVVSKDRLRIVTDRVRGAPDLVIEVLSPMVRIGGLDERLSWFAEYGVRECWLVRQPEHEVEVIRFSGRAFESRRFFLTDEPIRSSVLPRFDLSLTRILESPAGETF